MKLSKSFGKLRKNPLFIFILFLVLLFVIVFIINKSRQPKEEVLDDVVVKDVIVFDIGEKPTISTQALVKEAGTIQIVSQAGGIVSKIHVDEGDIVGRGKVLISIANNYMGGNAASVQANVAARQLQNINETFDTQKDLIATQKEIANKVDENSTELRNISNESISGTESVLNQSKDILSTLEDNLKFLEDNNTGGEFDEEILLLKQGITQLNGQIVQTQSGLKTVQYQTSDDNPPAELSTLQKDVTLKGLELQEKALYMGRDIAKLQLAAARIGASIFYPASPVDGLVEAVHATVNQVVTPGMPLITLNNPNGTLKIIAQIPSDLAPFVSPDQSATLHTNNDEVEIKPTFVSGIATSGDQHTIVYTSDDLPENVNLTEGSYVSLSIPLYGNCVVMTSCFVPIDSVHQTQELTGVYIVDEEGTVRFKEVKIGPIVGNFVEVVGGLEDADRVVVTRNVVDGDKVNL